MSLWTFLAFNACALLWSAVVLWAYYAGTKQINPVPRVTVPPAIASVFRRKDKGQQQNGEGEPHIPESVRRA